jgi:outer membrane biosynthesis protein TonB
LIGLVLCWSVAAAEPELPAAEAPAAEAPAGVRPVAWREVKAKVNAQPSYPRAARRQNLEADCKVRVFIDEQGMPMSMEVIACPPMFVESVTEAAMASRFFPFAPEGIPLKVSFVYNYKFRLADSSASAPPAPLPPAGDFTRRTLSAPRCPPIAPVLYPEAARAEYHESRCRVMLYFNTDGEVIHTHPIACTEPFLSAVRESTQALVCEPVQRRGEAIPAKAVYTVFFWS